MNPEAQHLLLDMWFDGDADEMAWKIANWVDHNLSVMERTWYRFSPHGLTLAYVLSESHFTAHTYPEHGYITMDIYLCSDKWDLAEVTKDILEIVKPKKYKTQIIKRGILE